MDDAEVGQCPLASLVIATLWWVLFVHASLSMLLESG
jgi:hypothetical protein